MARRSIDTSRVIVTGASSGIGRALVEQLVGHGAQVMAVARRQERLEALAASLQASPGRIEFVTGDVTDPHVRRAALDRSREAFGGVDILINNAGTGALGLFELADADRLRRIMDVNFCAPVEWIRDALPLLKQGTRPMVVNVGSVLGHVAVPYSSEYCASKFALRGITGALRSEFKRLRIDVLLVSPNTTKTEFFDSLIEREGDFPWSRPRGVSAEQVARETIRAIRRGRHEIVPSWAGRFVCWLGRLSPRLMDAILARYV